MALGSSTDATLTITNTGSYQATAMSGGGLAAPFDFKGGTYPGTGGTCAASLAGLTSCTVVVTYSPTALGIQNSSIDLAYNDGAAAQTTSRPVTGTGLSPAVITLSDGPIYDFGTLPLGSVTDKT